MSISAYYGGVCFTAGYYLFDYENVVSFSFPNICLYKSIYCTIGRACTRCTAHLLLEGYVPGDTNLVLQIDKRPREAARLCEAETIKRNADSRGK